jgi:hypothetical protein
VGFDEEKGKKEGADDDDDDEEEEEEEAVVEVEAVGEGSPLPFFLLATPRMLLFPEVLLTVLTR